jgi:hypothetical protein
LQPVSEENVNPYTLFPGYEHYAIVREQSRRRRRARRRTDLTLSFFDRVDQWPKCQRCRKRCSPVIPVQTDGGVPLPRNYCNKCGAPLEQLQAEHFELAAKNTGLIKTALKLHRRDLYGRFESDATFAREMLEWSVIPLALIARRYDPEKAVDGRTAKFSTYAVASMRNLLNKEFPFVMPLGHGGDSDDVFNSVSCNRTPFESLDTANDTANESSVNVKPATQSERRRFKVKHFRTNDFASYGSVEKEL